MNPFDQIRDAAQVFIRECQIDRSSRTYQNITADRYQKLRDAQDMMETGSHILPAHKGEYSRQAMEDVRYRISAMRGKLIPATNTDPVHRIEKPKLKDICELALLARTMCDRADNDIKHGR